MSRWAVPFLGVLAGTCMADTNINSTALVEAARSLSMPPALLPTAASLMSTCLAVSVVSVGLLADRMGRRRLLVLAMIVGIVAEVMTAVSPAGGVFLAGRALTGVAIGGVFSAAFATVRDVAAPGRQGAAMGVFSAANGITLLVVSLVGGGMATVDWRLAYLVVPVTFGLCLVVVPRLVPPVPRIGGGRVDVLGQVLLAIAVVAPLVGLGQASRSLTSPTVWGPVLLGLVAFAAFYSVERARRNAFYPV
ncbi:MAG: MFS transporter [Candidatus Nanopelagicales bacterium]